MSKTVFSSLSSGRIGGLVALLMLTLAACGDPPETAAPPETPAATANASGAPLSGKHGDGILVDGILSYPASDYHETEAGKPGGVLRATTATDPGSLDIHAISHGTIQWLGRFLFDCLVFQDEEGKTSPWLAKSWEISPDGKTYTFHLRDDVTFSNGEKFNAEAVLVNLEHMRDPATKSPLAAAYIAPYEKGRVVDEYTFEATLREPYTPFLDVLAQSWLGMIAPRQIREDPRSIVEHPIGTGPFVLERYVRDQGASFVRRNDYHWAPPVVRHEGPAYLERIQLDFVPEAIIRHSSLVSGQYDLTFDTPPQHATDIRGDGQLKIHSRVRKGNPMAVLSFNTERPPFDDVRVRRAIAHAIDREGLAWITGFGEYLPKADYLAANSRYYDPAFRNVLAYDVELANRLLDEAGWRERDAEGYRVKDGRRLGATQLVNEAVSTSRLPIAVRTDLGKIGFDLKIQMLTTPQILERRYSPDGNYETFAGGYWHTNTPDALYIYYHSNSITTPKLIGQNTSRLRDPLLDEWLGAARRTTDTATLKELYRKAQERLTELVPGVTAFESQQTVSYRAKVHVPVFDTSHNVPFITSIWIDPEAR
ncbi:MAG: ABC transporter substrate-binding protein [Azoarcus sp.]|jgi:peptide/nickel transport system substrate-binding protein|nr:ABC transporter substrate-binding protein [Azoarcus sp.]